MSDAVIAIVLVAAGTLIAVFTLTVQALARNHRQDTYLAWRRSMGPFFTFGYGPRSLWIQAIVATFITLALFAASGFFALRALFAN